MESYIKQLLTNNNRVIVPKLGAFLKKDQESGGSIHFNQFLKFDDGLLVNEVATKENIDQDAAKDKVQEFVKEINGVVGEGSRYTLKGLGSLYKDANGKIQFVEEGKKESSSGAVSRGSKANQSHQGTSASVSGSTSKTGSTSKQATSQPASSSNETSSAGKKETTGSSAPKTEKSPSSSAKTGGEANQQKRQSSQSSARTAGVQSQTSARGGASSKTVGKTTGGGKAPPSSSSFKKGTTSSGGGRGKYILWVALILVIIGLGIFFLLSQNNMESQTAAKKQFEDSAERVKEQVKKEQDSIKQELQQAEDSNEDSASTIAEAESAQKTKADSGEKAESKPSTKASATKRKTHPQNQFFVVAGAFRDSKNATNYVQTLRQKGYGNAREFGMIRDLHAICYDSYESRPEAEKAMKRIRREMGQDKAWLYQPNN